MKAMQPRRLAQLVAWDVEDYWPAPAATRGCRPGSSTTLSMLYGIWARPRVRPGSVIWTGRTGGHRRRRWTRIIRPWLATTVRRSPGLSRRVRCGTWPRCAASGAHGPDGDRDPPARLFDPHRAGAAWPCGRVDDDDVYPCAESRRERGVESVGWVVVYQL